MADVEIKPLLTYITRHLVFHDGAEYPMGSEIRLTDEKAIDALRKANAIALPNELEAPEETAAREQRLAAENDALRAEIDALRAKFAADADGEKSDAADAPKTPAKKPSVAK